MQNHCVAVVSEKLPVIISQTYPHPFAFYQTPVFIVCSPSFIVPFKDQLANWIGGTL